MPIIAHDKKIEPPEDAEIWRFLKLEFFRDLMANEELYFRRTDLYKTDDPNEGLPRDRYLRRALNLEPYELDDELQVNHHQASNRLHSECYYLSCWNLDDPRNRLRMWYRYAPYGVAIRSDYGRLKSALGGFLDEVHIGKVRYGDQEMTGYNSLQILFTKGTGYEWENEIRAVVCSYDPVGGQAQHRSTYLVCSMYLKDLLRYIQPNRRCLRHGSSSSSRDYQLTSTRRVHPIRSLAQGTTK